MRKKKDSLTGESAFDLSNTTFREWFIKPNPYISIPTKTGPS